MVILQRFMACCFAGISVAGLFPEFLQFVHPVAEFRRGEEELANGEFHSGEQLGETLGMSRAAINIRPQERQEFHLHQATVYLCHRYYPKEDSQ